MLISIIIPAYNEEENIGSCLKALMSQDFDKDKYEIIVIDDGSIDRTSEIVENFPGVRLLKQKNQGPAKARNWGAREAKGEFILFTDADCEPQKNWITEIMKPFEENAEIVAVKGAFETKQRALISRFAQVEYWERYDKLLKEPFIDSIGTDSAGFRRQIFLQAGGFDDIFPNASAEDVELAYRLANQGYKIIFNPKAKVYHLHADSIGDYWKKKYKFAYWRVLAVKKHPNKIWKDSHTPQTMKMQLLLFPLLLASMVAFPFSAAIAKVTFAMFLLTYLTSTMFIVKAFARDFVIGLVSPFFIFLRSSAQFLGVINGFRHSLRTDKSSA